ncbi:ABC transporter ATP-binding protein [Rhizobium sp. KVB221]|uniref:ABC transporter ATP-binding protein n=1 Tax=Rhizobium setariae TaxID=2801340 RepID=A0A936YN57_9HYPH|nr:ABC transporter ATP-binding protein [Rhizobium setariae]MBL0373510.1 ABC transporter ATP-binding protein [Rhizobium setariae]
MSQMVNSMTGNQQGAPLLEVSNLRISFGATPVVQGINFALGAGEILGIVGESGSGKTVSCRVLTGLLSDQASSSGQMTFNGRDYDLSDRSACAGLRGKQISMIFQDPMSALDPLMKMRRQLALRGADQAQAEALFKQVGFPDPSAILDRYPHQLSGGQCQRVAIACAMISQPRILVADEPTTALDVTIQAGILKLLKETVQHMGTSMIFITHDLSVVSELCNRVLVMRRGRIEEVRRTAEMLRHPHSTYTRSLLAAIPRAENKGQRLPTLEDIQSGNPPRPLPAAPHIDKSGVPVLSFRNVGVDYLRAGGGNFRAIDDINLDVYANEILGVVGESGSGKSTLSKAAVGLVKTASGEIRIRGRQANWLRAKRSERRDVQYIFQDPRGALDPARRVLSQVREPLDVHGIGERSQRDRMAGEELCRAGLEPEFHQRKPGSLSGGQRQRVTIARALALKPKLLICDESVSALDVSVQARILNMLLEIRAERNIAILFISHDLSVIQHLCDRVIVMRAGKIIETGSVGEVWNSPVAQYTQELLTALPQLPAVHKHYEDIPA